ncbi:unnamed protein product [Caenorhabditis auriculariae]|uniref:DUF7087 domain-containing protein n=1 Tax=Caenorhabditis auriculariae TaxID=2777116 RepID=A0A8S1HKV8_9PELO|nr:unnamed protein product [Caenorhabditis auriculariae]
MSDFQYNFPKLVYLSRGAQLILTLIEALILFSGSLNLSSIATILFLAVLIVDLYILIERISNNTDGRYDLRQINVVNSMDLRIRYIIGKPSFRDATLKFQCVYNSRLFSTCAFAHSSAAVFLLLVEFYEVLYRSRTYHSQSI